MREKNCKVVWSVKTNKTVPTNSLVHQEGIIKKSEWIVPILGYRMCLDLHVSGISRHLAIERIREVDHTQLFMEELKEGMTLLEIGANIGYYTLMAARIIGKTGKIIALEPDPRNIALLKRNLEINNYSDIVELHQMAASNKTGKAVMFQAGKSNLNTLIGLQDRKLNSSLSNGQEISIEATRIDDLLSSRNESINFVRMDIEGYEVEAIEGMFETLKKTQSPCKMLIETHPKAYSPERDFARILRQLFEIGFNLKGLISAGSRIPPIFEKQGYFPARVFIEGEFKRGYFENVKVEHALDYIMRTPKIVRYILLSKN